VQALIVDDSAAGGPSTPGDQTPTYQKALKAAGVTASVWDLSSEPNLPAGFLAAHPQVYWFTGANYPDPLGKYEPELKGYLDAGNRLFVSGMDLLDQGAGTTAFVHDYLHVTWDGSETQNDKPTAAYHGVQNTGVGGAFTAGVPANLPSDYCDCEDEITPNGPAVPQFKDDAGQYDGLAVRDTSADTGGHYRVVFLAFPFESFGTQANRNALAAAVFDYFTRP
jgi:hypothetical protein